MWWQEFHFLRPWLLLGLFVPFLISYKMWKNGRVQSSWAEVCDENLLQYLLIKGQNTQRKQPVILAVIICVLMILAISGPTWSKKNNPALMVNNPVMFVLNLSSDMNVQDVTPSRLDRAKLIIREMTQTLKGAETGLLVYSREPFVVTPVAEDGALVENLLPSITIDIMPTNGDRLDRAVDMAVDRMQKAGYHSGHIIVLAADVGEQFDSGLKSVATAKQNGFTINVIKLNAKENNKLVAIAQKGGGMLLNYNQNLTPLISKINNTLSDELKQSENMQAVWEDAGYYLLWLPALLLLYYFRRGVMAVLLLLMWSGAAEAHWFLNDNQEAMRLFEAKQYDEAAQKFQNPHWQAAAAYKSGDYKQALKQFNKEKGLDALYNQGNALAKSGKIEEAIAKYEEVLAQDEKFEDARFNLEYLKRQQKQQNQNNKQQDNRKDQDNNQDKQNQQDNQQNQDNQNQDKQEQNEQQSGDQKQQNQQQQQTGSEQQPEQNKQEQASSQQQEKSTAQENQENEDEQDDSQIQNQQNSAGENNQSAENDQNQDRNQEQNQDQDQQSNGANDNNQNQQDQSGDQSDNQNKDSSSEKSNENSNGQQQEVTASMSDEEGDKEAETMQAEVGQEESSEEKEKYRARMQRFREIPEDKGGLLRAFIEKEYQRRRYKD